MNHCLPCTALVHLGHYRRRRTRIPAESTTAKMVPAKMTHVEDALRLDEFLSLR
jgi:hypothetical protein